jgi:hypothetical protein
MHLNKALSEFSNRRVTRLQLPNLSKLKAACSKYQGGTRVREADDLRIKRVLGALSTGQAYLLPHRDIRFITAAIGSSSAIAQTSVNDILKEIERRHVRNLLRAVFTAFVSNYCQTLMRPAFRFFLVRHVNVLDASTARFAAQSGILRGDEHITSLAERICEASHTLLFCSSLGISSQVLESEYGIELKLVTVSKAVALMNVAVLQRVLHWTFFGHTATPMGDFYEAMLSPFAERAPPTDIQKLLMSVLVAKFGDPRIVAWPGLRGYDGDVRRQLCVAILKRWLSIEYLDLFINIIEKTSEGKQFKPRKAFWLKSFEKGVISDLTLILASDANKVARKIRGQMDNPEYMKWSTLSAALPNQSVLLMRIGDLIIAEWSHSGAMRFWNADDKKAPRFHAFEYISPQLRNGSLKVQVRQTRRDSIIHHENGEWMTWARRTIEHHTGVKA